MSVSILVFAGSTRQNSFNKILARAAANEIEQQGATATYVDLKDFPMPLYDGDFEQTQAYPESAANLKQLFQTHQGILLVSPEYNSSVTAVLKNTLDWLTRNGEGGGDASVFTGQVAGICSASPGGLGGLRGLVHVRAILGNMGCHVIPKQLAIGGVMNAFSESGELKEPPKQQQLAALVTQLIETCSALRAS